jgi:hypothetical protein
LPTCGNPPIITLVNKTDLAVCNISDGALTVEGDGGSGALEFSIDGSTFQSAGTFENLASNVYQVTVKDINSCTATISVEILNPQSTVNIADIEKTESGCKENNGVITVNAVGTGVLSFSINGDASQSSNMFTGLARGTYVIVVADDNGCELTRNVNLSTGVSYSSQVNNIIETNCAISNCHNGDNGANRNWTVFSNVQSNANNIKSRTSSGNMPPANSGKSLTQQEKDLIACWVDDGALNN